MKSFPALSGGFEIETEFTVHALQLRMPISEVRPNTATPGRHGKQAVHVLRDGWRILRTIGSLVKEEKPLSFFSSFRVVADAGIARHGIPVLIEFVETGLVPRAPTALLSAARMILSFLSLACGLILDSVARGRSSRSGSRT